MGRLAGMWKYLKCALAGHFLTFMVIERIDGEYWPVRETCTCGRVGKSIYPGCMRKLWHDHYKDLPTDFPPLFEEA